MATTGQPKRTDSEVDRECDRREKKAKKKKDIGKGLGGPLDEAECDALLRKCRRQAKTKIYTENMSRIYRYKAQNPDEASPDSDPFIMQAVTASESRLSKVEKVYHKSAFLLVTINLYRDSQLPELKIALDSFVEDTIWVKSYLYCFERRDESKAKGRDGLHCHLLLERRMGEGSEPVRPTRAEQQIESSFSRFVKQPYSSTLNREWVTKNTQGQVAAYILGFKRVKKGKPLQKKETYRQDREMRESMKLEDYYGNPKDFAPLPPEANAILEEDSEVEEENLSEIDEAVPKEGVMAKSGEDSSESS